MLPVELIVTNGLQVLVNDFNIDYCVAAALRESRWTSSRHIKQLDDEMLVAWHARTSSLRTSDITAFFIEFHSSSCWKVAKVLSRGIRAIEHLVIQCMHVFCNPSLAPRNMEQGLKQC